MEYRYQTLLLSLITMIVTGCMSQQIANTKQLDAAVMEQAAKSTLSPQQICESASLAIAKANQEELHFFAPLHLEQAVDSLEQGQKYIKKKHTESVGIQACFKVNKLVENGIAIKAKVQTLLSDVLKELDMLKKVDEANQFSDDIQDQSENIVELVEKIEAGKMTQALKGQAELLKEMLDLEKEIILHKNLSPVEAMLEKAEDADAEDLAEKTFGIAEKALNTARKYIQVNYRDDMQVAEVSSRALREARHAYYVAKEVETLKELKPGAAEKKVLYIESLFENINKKFRQVEVIGNSLDEQSSIIASRLVKVLDSHAALKREIVQLTKPGQGGVVIENSNEVKKVNQKSEHHNIDLPIKLSGEEVK